MISGICIACAALAVLCLRWARRQAPLGRDELARLSLYSDNVRRDELYPFE
jgi:hypothetical protein